MKNLLYLFVAIFLASCNKNSNTEIVYEDASTQMDVAYGTDAKQKIDIYLPAGRSKSHTKVFVLIHGGGWAGGDKNEMNEQIPTVQKEFSDYAIINVNYRLVNTATTVNYMLPYLIDDIHAALNHISQNAAGYGVKAEFVLAGVSAGGHLSMLYAYKYDTQKRVKAVVNIVGPSDFEDNYYKSYPQYWEIIKNIIPENQLPSGYTATKFGSPITWITNTSAPTLSFYGDKDELVPLSQKTTLDKQLKLFNVVNESYSYNGGHGIGNEFKDDILKKAKAFITKNVK